MTERAVYLTPPARPGEGEETYDRLYYGHEFCVERLPSPEGLAAARDLAAARGLAFTLVTPRLDEDGVARVRRLLETFRPREGDEAVVNDVGTLELARELAWPGALVAGRLLTKQRRGAGWKGELPAEPGAARYLRGSSLDSPGWVRWLLEHYGVERFELDNLLQGVEVGDLPGGVRLSVYHPYVVVTVTRHCPWRFDGRRWRSEGGCGAPCRRERLSLAQEGTAGDLLAAGMAQFLENRSGEIYSGPAVDRHVLQPRVPC